MNKIVQKQVIRGVVKIKKFDRDGNPAELFQGNRFWDFLNKIFGVDWKIPFVTGFYTFEGVGYNAITNLGLASTAKRLGGITADPISHMAIGEGTGGTTALNNEFDRDAVTPTSATTTTTDDTTRSVNTFAFTGAGAITEEGLLDAVSTGTLIAYRTFSVVNVANGDSLQITHDIVMSTS